MNTGFDAYMLAYLVEMEYNQSVRLFSAACFFDEETRVGEFLCGFAADFVGCEAKYIDSGSVNCENQPEKYVQKAG